MGKKIQNIGRYVMDGKTLGKGNFARVELATHEVTECKVAVKVIDTRKIKEECIKQNLHREARILGQLRHPNIIRLYETLRVTATTLYCLVTEYAGGGDLLSHLKNQKESRLSEVNARPFVRQLVSALHYLHERGVSHRDLKMENIMLDEQKKNIKLIDFGLSNTFSRDALMRTHCGSPEYAAPELFTVDEKYGPEIDVWSLGVIMYAMLVGKLPFTTPYTDQYRRSKLQQQIEKGLVEQHETELYHLSAECQELIHKKMEVQPELRISLMDIEIHTWLTLDATLPFFPFETLPRDKNWKTQAMQELSIMLNIKRNNLEPQLSEQKCDEMSAMYNMLLDKKRFNAGLFEIDYTQQVEINAHQKAQGLYKPRPHHHHHHKDKDKLKDKNKDKVGKNTKKGKDLKKGGRDRKDPSRSRSPSPVKQKTMESSPPPPLPPPPPPPPSPELKDGIIQDCDEEDPGKGLLHVPGDDDSDRPQESTTSANFDLLALCSTPSWLGPERRRSRRRSRLPPPPTPSPNYQDSATTGTLAGVVSHLGNAMAHGFDANKHDGTSLQVPGGEISPGARDSCISPGPSSLRVPTNPFQRRKSSAISSLTLPTTPKSPTAPSGLQRVRSLRVPTRQGSIKIIRRRPSSCGPHHKENINVHGDDSKEEDVTKIEIMLNISPTSSPQLDQRKQPQSPVPRPVQLGLKDCFHKSSSQRHRRYRQNRHGNNANGQSNHTESLVYKASTHTHNGPKTTVEIHFTERSPTTITCSNVCGSDIGDSGETDWNANSRAALLTGSNISPHGGDSSDGRHGFHNTGDIDTHMAIEPSRKCSSLASDACERLGLHAKSLCNRAVTNYYGSQSIHYDNNSNTCSYLPEPSLRPRQTRTTLFDASQLCSKMANLFPSYSSVSSPSEPDDYVDNGDSSDSNDSLLESMQINNLATLSDKETPDVVSRLSADFFLDFDEDESFQRFRQRLLSKESTDSVGGFNSSEYLKNVNYNKNVMPDSGILNAVNNNNLRTSHNSDNVVNTDNYCCSNITGCKHIGTPQYLTPVNNTTSNSAMLASSLCKDGFAAAVPCQLFGTMSGHDLSSCHSTTTLMPPTDNSIASSAANVACAAAAVVLRRSHNNSHRTSNLTMSPPNPPILPQFIGGVGNLFKTPLARIESFHSDDADDIPPTDEAFMSRILLIESGDSTPPLSIPNSVNLINGQRKGSVGKISKNKPTGKSRFSFKSFREHSRNQVPDRRLELGVTEALLESSSEVSDRLAEGSTEKLTTTSKSRVHPKEEQSKDRVLSTVTLISQTTGGGIDKEKLDTHKTPPETPRKHGSKGVKTSAFESSTSSSSKKSKCRQKSTSSPWKWAFSQFLRKHRSVKAVNSTNAVIPSGNSKELDVINSQHSSSHSNGHAHSPVSKVAPVIICGNGGGGGSTGGGVSDGDDGGGGGGGGGIWNADKETSWPVSYSPPPYDQVVNIECLEPFLPERSEPPQPLSPQAHSTPVHSIQSPTPSPTIKVFDFTALQPPSESPKTKSRFLSWRACGECTRHDSSSEEGSEYGIQMEHLDKLTIKPQVPTSNNRQAPVVGELTQPNVCC